jgi:polyhydroxybutyrate depolymerase
MVNSPWPAAQVGKIAAPAASTTLASTRRVRTSALAIVMVAACGSGGGASGEPDAAVSHDPDAGVGPDGASLAACTGKQAQPVDATWTIGGRNVRVHVPASYDPTHRMPVVLNLHGYSSDSGMQQTLSHMAAKADSAGFIAVHPDGHDSPRGWNAGVCCGAAATSGTNDVAWINAVLDEVEARACVDTSRVYATGLSNGAFMSQRLACEDAGRIAAIAPVAGVVGTPTCTPSRPVPVFEIHGTSDPLIPFNGGGVNGNESVPTTINRWVTANHCSAQTTTTYQHGDATCVTHGGCTDGADVTLCTIDGGGHQWPGGDSIGALLGKKSDDLLSTDAMWTFFAAHPMPATGQ